ncbi:hypothetical protein CIB48_g6501 [Xylaria polymorpha]|nr:hypothetical protein CIB48_g6501 [Xylaria polymorpha]
MTSKPHLGSNWSLASIDRASAKLQETNPSIKSVKNTTNSHDACQICTPDNSALAHPDLVDSVNPTVSHCSTAPTSKVLIDAGIQRPRLSQRKAASMRNHKTFYKTFGRPIAKVFLMAIFTYQLLYYFWVKLEQDEVRAEMEATISDLEARIEQLEQAKP